MKLKNKKTGEIVDLIEIVRLNDVSNDFYLRLSDNEGRTFKVGFNSLAELNEVWEDYEEPKEHYFITEYGGVFSLNEYEGLNNVANPEDYKAIGNYFETKEEAEKAVEKLKAWKRLKDKGFRFMGWNRRYCDGINYQLDTTEDMSKDLDLLFGGEE